MKEFMQIELSKVELPKVDAEQALENAALVFAKNCTNDHGTFVKGNPARRAFSKALVDSYLECGILVKRG